ncbi:flavin reductase family protein [Ruegeria sp. HKCCD8929]|uniref:flavin reductase family protein n=1 Tax=Ruegeria sp. HKCCD8929 TaxID=2683006 RepID=UPI0014890307|nr:flavin reductase family protein [Ruegeria sp. HKCCD8929]
MSLQFANAKTAFVPDASNTRLLRDAFGRFATGVTIVTTRTESGAVAITANSFASVSLDPPLVLWSPDRNSRRFPFFEDAEHYAIHVLAADQRELCWQVAQDAYALKNRELGINDQGVPILPDCLARFDCTQKAVYDGGDHAIVLGQVTHAQMRDGGDALAFYMGQVGKFAPG